MSWNNYEEQMAVNAAATGTSYNSSDDPDVFDESGEVNDPDSPIWDDSDVQDDCWGTEPA